MSLISFDTSNISILKKKNKVKLNYVFFLFLIQQYLFSQGLYFCDFAGHSYMYDREKFDPRNIEKRLNHGFCIVYYSDICSYR